MALVVTGRILAVLYVSIMGLTRCYKTTAILHLYYTSCCQGYECEVRVVQFAVYL